MKIYKVFHYLFSKHDFLRYHSGATVIFRATGLTTFLRDWKVYGFKSTWQELKDVIDDYYRVNQWFNIVTYWSYLKSLIRHKWYMFRFGKYLQVPLYLRILHDLNKFKPAPFVAYAKFFYGLKCDQTKKEMNRAWRNHLQTNKHHWQYWVINEDDGTKTVLDMPEKYVREMICDWLAANFAYGDRHIFRWYINRRFSFSDSTAVM